jgi:hypothetical protein
VEAVHREATPWGEQKAAGFFELRGKVAFAKVSSQKPFLAKTSCLLASGVAWQPNHKALQHCSAEEEYDGRR